MRIANLAGRLALVAGDRALDVETASSGAFSADPAAAFARWAELADWARGVDVAAHPASVSFTAAELGAPSPRPAQVIGIGLNYADHAAESGLPLPEHPMVFTKFPSSVVGPDADVRLPGDAVDWEVELVVVIGSGGRDIPAEEAYDRIAGFTVGQDISERVVQMRGTPPQFSLAKSFAGFSPIGPAIVTADELADPARLRLRTTLIGADGTQERVQDGSTEQLIFSVPELIARLSAVVELLPGDLIFTGTPPGVGMGRTPKRYLVAGESLRTEIDGIGAIVQRFHA